MERAAFTHRRLDSQPAAQLLRGSFDGGQAGSLPKLVLSKPTMSNRDCQPYPLHSVHVKSLLFVL